MSSKEVSHAGRQGLLIRCTLVYGDIYGEILIWLLIVFLSLASGLALLASSHPIAGGAVIGLFFVLSLPFLMFAFVTTLFNHIVLAEQSWGGPRQVRGESTGANTPAIPPAASASRA